MSMPPLPPEKEQHVQELVGMLGFPAHRVYRALEKCNWAMDRAADMLLNGTDDMPDLTVSPPGTVAPRDLHKSAGALNAPPPSPKSNSIIDLTGEDEDLAKAVKASLETPSAQAPPAYGIDSLEWKQKHWAVTAPRTDVPVASNEDSDLSRALEASLSSSLVESGADSYEDVPLKERARVPGHPVAVRGRSWNAAFMGHMFQALHYLPQVRDTVKAMRFEHAAADMQEAEDLQKMQKILAYLDHGKEAYTNIDGLMGDVKLNSHTQDPGPKTADILSYVGEALDTYALIAGVSEERSRSVLQSSVGDVNQPNQSSMAATVRVSHRHDSLDLMTALTDVMNGPHPWKCFHRLPEVLVFHVVHEQGGFPTAAEKKPFRFPPVFYPDRFMFDNAYEAQERIKQAESHAEAVQGLKTRRKALTELNGRDTRKDLRATLHYFGEVASDDGTADRKAEVESAKAKLSKILARVENEVDSIDAQVDGLQKASSTLFDTVDMQKQRYDLRAVLFHDGLYTRMHVWSCCKDDNGKWWKFQDVRSTEVDEASVLSESAGLHMGAGPYMLFYSRASDEAASAPPAASADWPESIARYVEAKNYAFDSELAETAKEDGGAVTSLDTVNDPMDCT